MPKPNFQVAFFVCFLDCISVAFISVKYKWITSVLFHGPNQVDLRRAVEEVVKETPEYRCMQSQFSVLYNESLQLKSQLDEARTLLHGTRSTHQRQVELIEVMAFSLCVSYFVLKI